MSDNGDLREDLKLPDNEIGQQLKTEHSAGKELLVSFQICIHLFTQFKTTSRAYAWLSSVARLARQRLLLFYYRQSMCTHN